MENTSQPSTESVQEPASRTLDDQMLTLIEKAKEDPFKQEAFGRLQKKTYDMIETIITEVSNSLPIPNADSGNAAVSKGGTLDVVALKNQSRQREGAAQQRRELVEAMVIGALLNRNNAKWDPFNPETSQPVSRNFILSMLQAKAPEQAQPQQEAYTNPQR
jgi:hypothetical protein